MPHDHHLDTTASSQDARLERTPGSSVSPSPAGGPLVAAWHAAPAVIIGGFEELGCRRVVLPLLPGPVVVHLSAPGGTAPRSRSQISGT